ncbi:MAG: MGMT family protein [bacterium]
MEGSFCRKVLSVAQHIPRGQILSYKEIARLAGSPNAYRAVGNILNRNRDPKIPCHRVVRSDGGVGGYNKGARKKLKLLRREGVKI